AFPTGDAQAKMVGNHQPATLAAMEGRFEGGRLAEVTMIGQPNVSQQRLENPIPLPGLLSFLAYGTFKSYVKGLNEFPKDTWPDNIELLYYSFHIMITLGMIFIGIMAWANWRRWRGRLESSTGLLWILMLAFPFPYIATSLEWREDKRHLGVILRTVSVWCGAHLMTRFGKELIVFWATFSSARFAAIGTQWDQIGGYRT